MKFTLVISPLLAALAVASPVAGLEERQVQARVQLTNSGAESARQFDIPINGQRTPILSGNGCRANQISIVNTPNVACQAFSNGVGVGTARGPNGSAGLGSVRLVTAVTCRRP